MQHFFEFGDICDLYLQMNDFDKLCLYDHVGHQHRPGSSPKPRRHQLNVMDSCYMTDGGPDVELISVFIVKSISDSFLHHLSLTPTVQTPIALLFS